jgi:hypothetical protein
MKRIVVQMIAVICGLWWFAAPVFSQSGPGGASSESESSTSNDLFIMLGSDFVRPGLGTRANYNIGLGHTFGALKKDPFGDEVTFAYTYENAGSHGFFHTPYGAHTEALGLMKNFAVPSTKILTGYTWIQLGVTA